MANDTKKAAPKMYTEEELASEVQKEVQKVTAQNGFKLDGNALADLMKAVLPATIMAMEQAKNQTAHDITLKQLKQKQALEEKCHICRQSVGDGKGRGCGGPWARNADGSFKTEADGKTRIEDVTQFHTEMVVFPNDPIAVQQFDGVQINGAHYRSHGPDHKVWVPKVNNIASILLKFEEDQRTQQVGRKHMRVSGSLSGNGGRQTNNPTFS